MWGALNRFYNDCLPFTKIPPQISSAFVLVLVLALALALILVFS